MMNNKSRIAQVRLKTRLMTTVSGLMCLSIVVATGLSSRGVEANTEHCSLELNDAKRNACYESNPEQQDEPGKSRWPVLKFKSYATHKPNASALHAAEGTVMCQGTEGTAPIGLHCADTGMKVVISLGCEFANPNAPTTIELHSGGDTSQWKAKVFRNQLGLSIEDSLNAHKFMKAMEGHSKAVVILKPQGAPEFVATYDLAGFDKALGSLEEACQL